MKQKTFRPRDMLNKEVAGICGVARLTDKARSVHAGEIGRFLETPPRIGAARRK